MAGIQQALFGGFGAAAAAPTWGSWTLTTLNTARNFPFISHANGLFVAPEYNVPGSPAGNYGQAFAWTSPNGTTWTQRTLPSGQQWRMPQWRTGLWVMPTDGANYATSPDAITWTTRTFTGKNAWGSASGGSNYVVVGYGTNVASNSTDGTTWVDRTLADSTTWAHMIYGAGLFIVAPASDITTYNTSPDGTTWTSRAFPAIGNYYNLGWNGSVVLVNKVGVTQAYTSTDGINWTSRTNPMAMGEKMISSVLGGQFILTEGANAYTSPDGVTWTARNLPSETFNGARATTGSSTTYVAGVTGGKIATITYS